MNNPEALGLLKGGINRGDECQAKVDVLGIGSNQFKCYMRVANSYKAKIIAGGL